MHFFGKSKDKIFLATDVS